MRCSVLGSDPFSKMPDNAGLLIQWTTSLATPLWRPTVYRNYYGPAAPGAGTPRLDGRSLACWFVALANEVQCGYGRYLLRGLAAYPGLHAAVPVHTGEPSLGIH